MRENLTSSLGRITLKRNLTQEGEVKTAKHIINIWFGSCITCLKGESRSQKSQNLPVLLFAVRYQNSHMETNGIKPDKTGMQLILNGGKHKCTIQYIFTLDQTKTAVKPPGDRFLSMKPQGGSVPQLLTGLENTQFTLL